MAFPLLKLLPGILKTIGKLTGLPLGDAATTLETAQLTPEQLNAVQDALQRHEEAMKALSVDELKSTISAVMSENLAMIQSPDKFVARARPTMLYAATGITTGLALAIGITIVRDIHIDLGATAAVLSLMTPLWGAGGYYIGQRTKEKLGGNGNSE